MKPCSEFPISREMLEYLYNVEYLTIGKIADRLGYSATTIGRWLHEYGIPRRTKCDYRLNVPRQKLYQLYNEQGLVLAEIGNLFGCSGRTIGRRLKEFNIPARHVGPVSGYTVPIDTFATWSPELAYVVGLITADGSLCSGQNYRVEFTSTEVELVELLQCAAFTQRYSHRIDLTTISKTVLQGQIE